MGPTLITICIVVGIGIIIWVRYRVSTRVVPYTRCLVSPTLAKSCRAPPDTKGLTWILWQYLPDHPTEHTRYMHTFVKHFIETYGYRVTIVVPKSTTRSYDGVQIHQFDDKLAVEAALCTSVAVLSEKGASEAAAATAQAARLPLFLFVFDEHMPPSKPQPTHLYSSDWLKEKYPPDQQGIVVRRPIFAKQAITHTSREYITYIDLGDMGAAATKIKQGLPDFPFLYLDARGTKDVRAIYKRTGILCILSDDELYVSLALEAAMSGIPIISCPHQGIQEVLGDCVIYVERGDTKQWINVLKVLKENVYYYERLSRAISKRAKEYQPMEDLERLQGLIRAA